MHPKYTVSPPPGVLDDWRMILRTQRLALLDGAAQVRADQPGLAANLSAMAAIIDRTLVDMAALWQEQAS